ncbi:AMP-binding protein [Streptomyces stelliscabiei]|uniref:2-aminobenzoate-CoA ligase n=1 Tax=Streptomyces stelliscabiei TaxID=146820 RepID=A0A8I0P1H2_9ACTN|nr:AMP-binding protein [Streptomyces stelliscabiei]KND40568.1 2-aminobenzoate-CoA ligase [Streptomyces stelliscabiei]MBE1594571.1 2-aminobenzoate-CoA ligase [Streptomyces stelliscabiei]MDX2521053.1 AMP-binding protein [Streptomyces stelliscabiei]
MTLSPSGHVDTFARDHLPGPGQWPVLEFTTDLLQYPERLNAAVELIDRPAAAFGSDRPALRTPEGEVWSYGELRRRAAQVAQVLTEDLGLVPGNRVLLRSPNTPWAVAAWLGVLRAGGIAVATMAALRARELAPIVAKTRPAVALVDHRFLDDVFAVRDTNAPKLVVVPYGGDAADDLSNRAARKSGRFAAVDTAADDVALFGPTSGTTGVPKITTHFHRDILSIDNTFGKHTLRLRSDDLVACTAPLAFTFGLGMLVVFALRAGACAFLTEPVPPPRLADLVAEHGVTVLATAPTAYKQIVTAGKVTRLAGLRRAISAGEHIPQGLWEELRDLLGIKVIDGIGATEMLHIFISADGDDIRPGATGRPVPGYRAAILGPDGEELGPGAEGLLGVIGPVGCRYLDDERQAGYVVNGWNVTGDTFLRDEDGYFWYRARNDSLIVSSGYNIAGPEVEAAIDTHPDVVEAAVVGAPDAERGAIVCAFVVLREGVVGDAVRAKDIQDHVKRQIAPYKYPREVRFVEALPRNPSGKLQHFRLRRLLEEQA